VANFQTWEDRVCDDCFKDKKARIRRWTDSDGRFYWNVTDIDERPHITSKEPPSTSEGTSGIATRQDAEASLRLSRTPSSEVDAQHKTALSSDIAHAGRSPSLRPAICIIEPISIDAPDLR